MKKKNLYFLSLAFLGLFGRVNAQCDWVSVGPGDTDQIAFGIAEYNSAYFDPTSNSTYVAFYDENYYGASIRKYSGGQWTQVGAPSVCNAKAIYESMTVDKHGIPYMACQDPNRTGACSVFMFNGTNWMAMDSGLSDPASYISLATDKNGVPYVAYEDGKASFKLVVLKYNGTRWVHVVHADSLGITRGKAQYIKLAFDTNTNTPYVAFEDAYHHDNVSVYSYNGTSWGPVGGNADSNGVSADTGTWVSMAIDKSGNAYVGYADASVSNGLSVMMWNGTAWSAVGAASSTTGGPVDYVSLGVDASDNVYVAYQDESSYGYDGISAVEYTGGNWNYVGGSYKYSQDFSEKDAEYISLIVDNTNTPSIVYEESGNGDHAEMFKWNSANKYWALQRGLGFPASVGTGNGTALYISVAAQPTTNTIYAAFQDGNHSNKASVMSYSGSTWSDVGTPGMSLGLAKFTNMGFDAAGDPICMYTDDGSSSKYSVSAEIYKGGTWNAIGTNSNTVSGASCYYLSMAISSADTIFAAYETSNYHMAVMKCAVGGSTWVNVGGPDVDGDSAAYESIAIDKNGVPYVAFAGDVVHDSSGVSVMKYVSGKGWQFVGKRCINLDYDGVPASYPAEAIYPSIQIDPATNLPVVAYTQYAGSYNAHCQRFDGTNWNYVGSSGGYSGDWTDYMSLAIDQNSGAYYTAYQDWSDKPTNFGQRNITVTKFDPKVDTTWRVLPANTACSQAGSSTQSITVDGLGNVYVGFTNFSGYVKELACPTGIESINGSSLASATVYPNPNNGSFTVALQNASPKSRLMVYNVLGENVYSSVLNSDETEINLGTQAPGIYLYRILTDDGQLISTGKVVINK